MPDCSLKWSSNPCVDVPMPQVVREGDVFKEAISVADMLALVIGQVFEGAMAAIAAKEEEAAEAHHRLLLQ